MIPFLIIFSFSIVGEWIATHLPFPIPGSIIGMLLLFLALLIKLIKIEDVKKGGTTLTQYLSFFFIPLTVGVLDYLNILSQNAFKFMGVMALTLIATYVVTAKVVERKV